MRVYTLSNTKMMKRVFAICFWLFMHLVKGKPNEGKAKESRRLMEESLK